MAISEGISGNPGAVNTKLGLGLISKLTRLDKLGIFLGGLWVGNGDYLFGGGIKPRSWNFNSVFILDLQIDSDLAIRLPGGRLGVSYLRFNGQPANSAAGIITGYDGLTQASPLVRDELYQLWWRQSLFHDKLIVRVGKTVPTYDFNNVVKPVPVNSENLSIPAVTGLIYTPAFVNPSILGNLPGYYNSAYGVTTTFAPLPQLYFSYGIYDGNLARGVQTGLKTAPEFTGYYFQIGEAGYAWLLGQNELPRNIGAGGWGQTGRLTAGSGPPTISENGVGGFYCFGAQRLWFQHPRIDNSGLSAFYQFGINDSSTMLADKYFGFGITGVGLVPRRSADSIGTGLAWSWLNRPPGSGRRSNEAMLATYYQMHVFSGIFLQPTFTFIPNPGAATDVNSATALTLQAMVLF
ncbi:MAG: carbohydrate porin [Deltaproteobacteria bacterium]|nr:carbohydrate porin [Deltaproteobacteria bacterium]